MSESRETQEAIVRLSNLIDSTVDAILELDHRIIELESDIYDMKRENTELRRLISNLESKKRMPPF